jgi:hypothetical protein
MPPIKGPDSMWIADVIQPLRIMDRLRGFDECLLVIIIPEFDDLEQGGRVGSKNLPLQNTEIWV